MHVNGISLQEEDPDVIDGDEGEKLTVIGGPIGEDLLMSKYLGVMTSMASASLPAVKNVSSMILLVTCYLATIVHLIAQGIFSQCSFIKTCHSPVTPIQTRPPSTCASSPSDSVSAHH